ncbi:MAG: cellulase family glycosylhydrolase [Alistipes sp.]|nr:cellulase family glycosylhydrolase [Alistipes sp.]
MFLRKLMLLLLVAAAAATVQAQEIVYQDREGVIRYKSDGSEVAVFGANYCLPSACDYRAADRVAPSLDEKHAMIDEDMAHFARMGFRALRLSFWGDWENCDAEGNLLDNEHLDLLDYLIHRASERDILMLLSPTVVHAAWWPEGFVEMPGFSARYPKGEMTFDPAAIRAQQNYMTQLLEHTNRYSGRKYKFEPNIIAIEIINEPARIDGRNDEIAAYIDAMHRTIRRTGCRKIVAYNISENFRIAPAVISSKAECATYGWYPTQLNHGHTLRGNFLPCVDDYAPMRSVDIGPRSKMVYEFDAPDLTVSYMYPAQVREFREGGVQFAAMFSYDMLRTAPWNLGWQTHLLNMVYTPRKAVSAMIAVKGMETLERGRDWGRYPQNTRFGDIAVDPDADRSIYCDGRTLYYSNSAPADLDVGSETEHIAGVGSSPLVEYDGTGIYFLDKIEDGVWRLEVYPDVVQLDDPFRSPDIHRRVFALLHTPRRMRLSLPDLGDSFRVQPLTGSFTTHVDRGSFDIAEGVYILAAREEYTLPEKLGRIGMAEYHPAVDRRIADERVTLFDAPRDRDRMLFTRSEFYSPRFDCRPSAEGNLRLYCEDLTPHEEYRFPADVSAQSYVGDRLRPYIAAGLSPHALRITARAATPSTARMKLLLNIAGAGAWGAEVELGEEWRTVDIPVGELRPDRAPMLPQDWPGINPYYRPDAAESAAGIDWLSVENIFFSLRTELYDDRGAAPKGIEVSSAELVF